MYFLELVISLPNFLFFSLLRIVFIVTTQGTLPFSGYFFAGQTSGGFLSAFKAQSFSIPLVVKLKMPQLKCPLNAS